MTAYAIIEEFITDPEGHEKYKPLAAASIATYGGTYKSRGGTTESLEGDSALGRIVVLEFPDFERARQWYNSDQYQEASRLRQAAARSRIFIVDGNEPG